MVKIFLAFVLTFSVILSCFSITAFAAGETWIDDGAYDISWFNDASQTTFNIDSAAKLAGFAAIMNGKTSHSWHSFANKTIKLTADIDLGGRAWVPVNGFHDGGESPNLRNFTFDGNGKTIKNMTINTPVKEGFYSGFLGVAVGDLVIKDVTFENADVNTPTTNGAAVVIGEAYANTLFKNVKVINSKVQGNCKVGSILGFTGGDGRIFTFENCESIGNQIVGTDDVGGVAGLINTKDSAVITPQFKMSNVTLEAIGTGDRVTYEGDEYLVRGTTSLSIHPLTATAYNEKKSGSVTIGGQSYSWYSKPVDFAAQVGDNYYMNVADAGKGGTEVTANAEATYMVVIPATVDFGTISKDMQPQERDFVVSVQGALIDINTFIQVKNITDDMKMYDETGQASLAFTLDNEIMAFTQAQLADGSESITNKVRCIPADLTASGSYKGAMTFEIMYLFD